MQKRHYGHRSEVKTCADGLGEHFHRHALELRVNHNNCIEQIMENCSIVIIESVELDQPWSKIWRLTCKTLDKHGGMNRREDRKGLGS